jgi:hypothetical protein
LIGRTNGENLFPVQVAGEDRSLPSQPTSPAAIDSERIYAMAYGLSTRAFSENGPAEQAARARTVRTPLRSWQALDDAVRLELIEQALRAANDRIDGYPLAL